MEVKDKSCYSATYEMWIPFNTTTDALVASLSLHHGFPRSMFEIVLEVVRNPSFRLDDLTLSSELDVASQISECRLENAFRRGNLNAQSEPARGVPLTVVQLVADHLAEQADAAKCIINDPLLRNREKSMARWALRSLQAMSLVHRTWTTPAQQARRYHPMTLKLGDNILKFLDNPFCGPWTQWIELEYPAEHSSSQRYKREFESLVYRAPNICSLILKGIIKDDVQIETFTRCISQLRNLRNLNIRADYTGFPTLVGTARIVSLVEMISSLPCLEVYSFKWKNNISARGHLDARHTTRLEIITPPSTLKTLVLDDLDAPLTYLKWLLESRGDYRPDHISLTIRQSFQNTGLQLLTSMSTTLSRLRESDINIFSDQWLSAHYPRAGSSVDRLLVTILNSSQNLQRLKLTERVPEFPVSMYGENTNTEFETGLKLPATLQIFDATDVEDKFLSVLVSARELPSSLRTVFTVKPLVLLPLTRAICRNSGIELTNYRVWS